ncbi:MAG: TrkH family potassium uptake protein [Burkholderiales bacterium]
MNFGMIRYICGQVIRFEAGFMALSAIVALLYSEYHTAMMFSVTILGALLLSLLLAPTKPTDKSFHAKEGIITVSISWVIISLIGAVPFTLTGSTPTYIDSIFETISGFSTTGSSLIPNVEVIDKGILFWRSFTHWIGGMGVLVFVMAILPMSGADPFNVMRAESPGPTKEKLVPKARQTASILYKIYIVLTLAQIVLLLFGGMPLFDSVVHTFGTAGTGGFSIKNLSIGYYNSVYIDVVITVFMILYGINFSAFFLLVAGKFKKFLLHEEMRTYLGIIIVAILIIAINLMGPAYSNFAESLRYSSFQVASIITTTGYATTNFDSWPTLSKYTLVFLMFIGACAGSTGGGIKVSRILIMFKTLKREAFRLLHPNAVKLVKLEGVPLSENIIRGTGIFVVTYVGLTAISIMFVSIDGFDMETTATAVITCISNVGPGLGGVGPIGNFSGFSAFSKIILSFDMLAGRLEIFPVLMLFWPAVWRRRNS